MKSNLIKLKELILLFRNEVAERVLWGKDHSPKLDKHILIEPWEKTEAYSWIFLEPNYTFFCDMAEESRRKNISSSYPKGLLVKAKEIYSKWGMKTIEIMGCKTQAVKIKEIHKYKLYGIPEPTNDESLIEYIERLRELVNIETYSKKTWEESLGCFLQYVRDYIPPECCGFIDVIFPQDRTFYSDMIIRLIRKDKFPTNIVYVSKILKQLSEDLLWGDSRTQHGAAETLAFSWLCLISARLRLPTRVKLLYEVDFSSLSQQKSSFEIFPNRFFLEIPTFFGHIPMEISKLHFDYFSILQGINQKLGIMDRSFKSTERSLREVFDRATSKLSLPSNHGEITFQTFTSWPTEVLHHRTQIENKRYLTEI